LRRWCVNPGGCTRWYAHGNLRMSPPTAPTKTKQKSFSNLSVLRCVGQSAADSAAFSEGARLHGAPLLSAGPRLFFCCRAALRLAAYLSGLSHPPSPFRRQPENNWVALAQYTRISSSRARGGADRPIRWCYICRVLSKPSLQIRNRCRLPQPRPCSGLP